jgi:hypothetical protein
LDGAFVAGDSFAAAGSLYTEHRASRQRRVLQAALSAALRLAILHPAQRWTQRGLLMGLMSCWCVSRGLSACGRLVGVIQGLDGTSTAWMASARPLQHSPQRHSSQAEHPGGPGARPGPAGEPRAQQLLLAVVDRNSQAALGPARRLQGPQRAPGRPNVLAALLCAARAAVEAAAPPGARLSGNRPRWGRPGAVAGR